MTNAIYSAAGCARCNIAKRYMKENGIDYEEFDIKAEGKDAFSKFYRENRKDIFRDKDGVEFPVFTNGKVIRQGVSVVVGYLAAGDKLQGFIGRSELHGVWLDGIDISSGDPENIDDFIKVLSVLKQNGLKIQAATFGRNSGVLEVLLKKGLVDRVVMEVKGTLALYPLLVHEPIEEKDIKRSIQLTSSAPEYSFFTDISPISRGEGQVDFLAPEEIGAAAKLIEEVSGSKKHSYTLRPVNPVQCADKQFHSLEELSSSAFFKFRSAARRYQVMTEVEK
jgi:glutaredoxin